MLLETGFALLIQVTLTVGGVEVARYVFKHQKLERVVASVGDLVLQAEILTTIHADNKFDAAQHVIKPFEVIYNGVDFVSSGSGVEDSPPQINWQMNGDRTLIASSEIGVGEGDATLLGGFTLVQGNTDIIAGTFYD